MAYPSNYSLSAMTDNYIDSTIVAGGGFGALTWLSCGFLTGKVDTARRMLLRIDLSGLPPTFRIQSAELWMTCWLASAVASPAGLHAFEYEMGPFWISPAGAQWDDTATWVVWKTANNWILPGGDCETASFYAWTLPTTTGDVKIAEGEDLIDYLEMVRQHATPLNLLLKRDAEVLVSGSASFRSNEYATEAERPRLLLGGVDRTVHVRGTTRLHGKATIAG